MIATGPGTATWTHRHLLDVDDLSRAELETVLDLAVEMRAVRAARQRGDTLAQIGRAHV